MGELNKKIDRNDPLVSVGIPTFNRPDGLRKTLECITGQTYPNLEIIISDNYSPGTETEDILKEFSAKDGRIQYYLQRENKGPANNSKFVLKKSTGVFFMWAADDDIFGKTYIEHCINEFLHDDSLMAVSTEAQYFDGDRTFDFFKEGEKFYSYYEDDSNKRILFMINNNYGNLFYSLYKREALFEKDQDLISFLQNSSINEIPYFLYIIQKGNWKILPEIGYLKQTTFNTYIQAKWETNGGSLPLQNCATLTYGYYCIKYHLKAWWNINKGLGILNLKLTFKISLAFIITYKIFIHTVYLVFRYKPKPK